MWHKYRVPPIDMKWEHLKTVENTARELFGLTLNLEELQKLRGYDDEFSAKQFLRMWESAKFEAGNAGWEGDFRNPPVVFWVPAEDEFECGFVIKQDNNGTTFVISPVPFLHFNEFKVR